MCFLHYLTTFASIHLTSSLSPKLLLPIIKDQFQNVQSMGFLGNCASYQNF